jgi:predicted dehydrogenase
LGLKTLPNVEIAAVADHRSEALEALRQRVELPTAQCYTSAAELLRAEKVDLVCVATNTVSHIEVAQLAVEAGVPRLIVEKPIGNCVAKARRLAQSCMEQRVKVAVNHSRRWSGDYAAIKRCVEHGFIGALREIHAVPGPGGLAMVGSHYFDLIAYLGGSHIAWVSNYLNGSDKPNRRGTQFKDPGGHCLIGLQNGVRGSMDVSDDLGRWDGFVVLRGDAGRIEIDERAREWHLINGVLSRRTFQFIDTTKISGWFAKVAAEMLSEASPSCGTAEGIEALEAIMAAHVSGMRSNSAVCLPLQGEDADLELPFP